MPPDAIPQPVNVSVTGTAKTPAPNPQNTAHMQDQMAQTVQQNFGSTGIEVATQVRPPKKRLLSPLVLGIVGLFALFVIGAAALGVAYKLGLFGGTQVGNNTNRVTPTPATTPGGDSKGVLLPIPGGTFTMGRNKEPYEYGEHTVQVAAFQVTKTEITNAEYLEFVKDQGHVAPSNWSEKEPKPNTGNKPVAYVSMDDAIAYAKWRSLRDGGVFRLPTEQEWEYLARNGAAENLFPWGNDFVDGNAVMGKEDSEPADVNTKPQGANIWGVVDLIGNVWEWTSTEYHLYPGSESKLDPKEAAKGKGQIMIRGGSADEKPNIKPANVTITATFRNKAPRDAKNKVLGFRLVKEN
jgi:iron(II)-dependent oxidoreductase